MKVLVLRVCAVSLTCHVYIYEHKRAVHRASRDNAIGVMISRRIRRLMEYADRPSKVLIFLRASYCRTRLKAIYDLILSYSDRYNTVASTVRKYKKPGRPCCEGGAESSGRLHFRLISFHENLDLRFVQQTPFSVRPVHDRHFFAHTKVGLSATGGGLNMRESRTLYVWHISKHCLDCRIV